MSSQKTLTFTVKVKFESSIDDDRDVLEVAANIARAIKAETNGIGISPQNGDTYLERIEIKPQFLDETIIVDVID